VSYIETLESIEKAAWITAIPEYQLSTLREMGLKEENPEEIAQKWLAATTSQTSFFASGSSSRPFFDNIRKEIVRFICDDTAYTEVKNQLNKVPGGNPAIIVSSMTAGISAVVGTSAVLLCPVVALILYGMGKITKTAFCKTYFTEDAKI
jgi:hypothetical protein